MNLTVTLKGILEIPIEIESYYPGSEPIINRLPEDCEPGEPAEVEWLARIKDIPHDELVSFVEALIDEDEDDLTEQAMEAATQEAIDLRDDYFEAKSDVMREEVYLTHGH